MSRSAQGRRSSALPSAFPIGAPRRAEVGERSSSRAIVEVVNLGGMYVATPRFPELGDYVDLIFSLPGDPAQLPRSRERRVPRCTRPSRAAPPGFGARFERPPLGLLEAIKAISKKEH